MPGLNDGLGFEEVNKEVTFTEIISGTNIYAAGSLVASRLNTSDGAIFSANIGSATSFGAKVQAGIVGPLTDGSQVANFGQLFANTNYAITVTALGSLSIPPYVFSGTALHT